MHIFTSFHLGEVEVSNLTILVLVFFSSFTFVAVGISSYKLYKSLIKEPNVYLTPHVGGYAQEALYSTRDFILKKATNIINGKKTTSFTKWFLV